jgi:F-type H+-transporting ATPase subunit delta
VSSPTQIAKRYAEALADAAEAQGQLTAAAEELHVFAQFVAESKELQDVFASPAVTPDDKAAVLEAVIERAKPTPFVANFLRVLLKNFRIHYIAEIDEAFAAQVDRRVGVVAADVTTAGPLTDAERQVLADRLTTMTGKKVKLTYATNPELIGGVVTRIGSRIYDGSIRAQLEAVKRQMSGQTR